MALGQVPFVNLPDALHLGIAQTKFVSQPGQIIAAGSQRMDANPLSEQV